MKSLILFSLLVAITAQNIPHIISSEGCLSRPTGAILWLVYESYESFHESESYWVCFQNDVVTHNACLDINIAFNNNISYINETMSKHCNHTYNVNSLYLHCSCKTYPSCNNMYSYDFVGFNSKTSPVGEKCRFCDGKECGL